MKFKEALRRSIKGLSSEEFKKRVKEEDETMLKHIKILEEINELEYLTVDSQAGRRTQGKTEEGDKYDIWERSYIVGFMEEERGKVFLRDLNIKSDKVGINVGYCEGLIRIPSDLDIPLTIGKKKDDFIVHTHMSSAIPKETWDSYLKLAKINKTEKVVLIFCLDPKWNRTGSLFNDVRKLLKK